MLHRILEELFSDRVGVLATMHRKEQVMAPLLEQALGIKIIVPDNFDTDRFGTFTRDIDRAGSQFEAARFKAEAALEVTGCAIAFASEGTFNPHPLLPGVALNRELVIFIDKQHEIEIIGQEASLETNFNHKIVKSFDEAYTFAQEVGFPSHGLVVMSKANMIKGITTKDKLLEAVNFALSQSPDGSVHIETDMRAHFNPTRMKNIEKATVNLIQKINSLCPKCGWPGFEVVDKIKGLPCALCNSPTLMTLAEIYHCKKCGFSKDKLFPNGLEHADPAQCEYCNP
jgi:hypothetical protein